MAREPDWDDGEEPTTNVTQLSPEMQKELAARAPQQLRACLIVLAGSNVGEMYRLETSDTVLGRGQHAAVKLIDDGVSRRHARIVQDARGDVLVEDLGSANGTFVNGERVERRSLKDGDKVRLGNTTVLKFTYHDKLDERFAQQMYDAALRDPLTQAFNKKYLLDRLTTELAYAKRHGTQLSVLMIDVDHFKRVNDTYGHIAGDSVLLKLTKLVTATLRAEDVFGRYGGEEFSVICRGITPSQAGILAERLRRTIEGGQFEHEGKRLLVTASVGVATMPEAGKFELPAQIIAAADEALYEAKRTGRNRVVSRP